MSRLGTTVRKLREKKGLSMHELAVKTNLNAKYIGRLEQGKEVPSKEEVQVLARELGTNTGSLLALMPKLDENLMVYLNSNHHVVALVKAIASSNLKEDEVNKLRKLVEEQSLAYVLSPSGSSSKEAYQSVKKFRK
jgi:transcriptional regulator with XRE-family HTH domain